ncbi:hypothetical protein E2C01_007751 [Portunus trituberculatus]|uniref:Uncharacterized protein n=1 Tax=Portunus trituberculatus TaxID=210409 RepID=A0A5B7CZU0_PORTR|nr:hypothetical protein [Portunus trituberculatus]
MTKTHQTDTDTLSRDQAEWNKNMEGHTNSHLGSQMCSLSLNKSKIFFSTSTPHFQTFLRDFTT